MMVSREDDVLWGQAVSWLREKGRDDKMASTKKNIKKEYGGERKWLRGDGNEPREEKATCQRHA